LSFDATLTKR